MNRYLLKCIILMLIALSPNNLSGQTYDYDKVVDHWISKGFRGSVLVANANGVQFTRGTHPKKSTEKAFGDDYYVDIGSTAKQFTAAGILVLESAGKVKVDHTLDRYFDDVPADKKGITLQQLLTHTAGFGAHSGPDYRLDPPKKVLESIFVRSLSFEPGTGWSYSNMGYTLLGMIIEKVSGMSYEQFLNKELFQKAGMTETGYVIPKWDKTRFPKQNGRTVLDFSMFDDGPSWNLKANGGILSTPNDMYKWYKALFSGKILTDRSFKMLFGKQAEVEGQLTVYGDHYGYGWFIGESPLKTPMWSHSGGGPMFIFDFQIFPEEKIVVITSSFEGEGHAVRVARDLAEVALGVDPDLDSRESNSSSETTGVQKVDEFKNDPSLELCKGLIATINQGEEQALLTMIDQKFDIGFVREIGKDALLQHFKQLHNEFGVIELIAAEKTGEGFAVYSSLEKSKEFLKQRFDIRGGQVARFMWMTQKEIPGLDP